MSLYGEMHRFIPAIASGMGIEVAEIPVNQYPRTTGKSKYVLFCTVKVVLDLLTVKFLFSSSTRPIHVFGLMGLVSGGLGTALAAWLSYQRLFMHVPLENRPLLFLAVLLIAAAPDLRRPRDPRDLRAQPPGRSATPGEAVRRPRSSGSDAT